MMSENIINEELETNRILEERIKTLDSLILEEKKIEEILKSIKNDLNI